MNTSKQIKLFRIIFYDLATLFFFLGALLRVIWYPDTIAYLYIICAAFYVLGVSTDTYIFIKDKDQ